MGLLPIKIGGNKHTALFTPPYRELRTEQIIDVPRAELFQFFSKAENLETLTPKSLNFNIETPLPITMAEGTIIDYTIRLNRIPILWRTKITRWDPPYGFTDAQILGPYSYWIHDHDFEELGSGRTRMIDTVRYRSIGGLVAKIPHFLFVDRQVKSIFDFRRDQISTIFAKQGRQDGQRATV